MCIDGACDLRCEWTSCPDGETCLPDGRCVADACVDVPCDPGTYCRDGLCLDSCEGAVCPEGEHCELGECVPGVPAADADADADPDGGADADADPDATADATVDGAGDASPPPDVPYVPPVEDPSTCNCRAPGGQPPAPLLLGLLALLAGLLLRRRC